MNARMEQIKTRIHATTTGPWTVPAEYPYVVNGNQDQVASCRHDLDAHFIAHSRSDLEYLLSRLAVIEMVCESRFERADEDPQLDKSLAQAIVEVINVEVQAGVEGAA